MQPSSFAGAMPKGRFSKRTVAVSTMVFFAGFVSAGAGTACGYGGYGNLGRSPFEVKKVHHPK